MSISSQNKRISTKRLTFLALSVAGAMVLSYVEFLLPAFTTIPGVKIGLPNIIVISLLYLLGIGDAVTVSLIRVLLSALLFSPSSALYSLCGAILSILVMLLLKSLKIFSMPFVSIAGAITHNLSQIAVFYLITRTEQIIAYLPLLLISGIISGLAVGIISVLFTKYVRKSKLLKNNVDKN